MKCAVCGKEFGAGNTCQYCGTDRVTGLGNYSGYDVPADNWSGDTFTPPQSEPYRQDVFTQSQIEQTGSIVCYACGDIIPADSIYCPQCSQRLFEPCPKCGHKCSTRYPACNACGTNRSAYLEEQRKKIEKEKAEKARTEKERKEVKEEAERIRTELEYDATRLLIGCSILPFAGLVIALLFTSDQSEMSGIIAVLTFVIFPISTISSLSYAHRRTRKNIKQWIEKHPNHRAIPYLNE